MRLPGIDAGSHIDPSIQVKRSGRSRRVRTLWRLPCSGPTSFGVHNNSVDNVCRGLTERVLNEEVDGVWVPVRQPSDSDFAPKVEDFTKACEDFVFPTTPISKTDLVLMYVGRKRVNYQRALESLSIYPVRRRDARLKTFVKCEKVDFAMKVNPAPRIIQPRDPRYNLSVGVYLKPLEHKIYEMVDSVFSTATKLPGKTVMKGLNADQQGREFELAWRQFADPVAIDLDASRWDRHVSPAALRWEHRQYLRWFQGKDRDELARLLSWQIDNDFVAFCPDGFVKGSVKGRRSSGDMNTAVGNVVIMCALCFGYFRRRLGKFRLLNCGDDSVLITERACLNRLGDMAQWFLEAGFLLKQGPVVDVLEKVVFCQTQPVKCDSGYRMCRDPHVVLQKDSCSILPLSCSSTTEAWLHAVGTCGLALAGDIPVLGSYYNWMCRHGRAGSKIDKDPTLETGMFFLARGMHHEFREPSVETRVSFWRAFGIDGTVQRLMEDRYRRLPFSYSVINLPVPDRAFVSADVPNSFRYRTTATCRS